MPCKTSSTKKKTYRITRKGSRTVAKSKTKAKRKAPAKRRKSRAVIDKVYTFM
jgi:DNA-binding PadR family transcriptional regulator